MPHIQMSSKRHFKDIGKAYSNLDTCPEAASRGDFPILPTEIKGILP